MQVFKKIFILLFIFLARENAFISNTIKRGALTLIPNPNTEISSDDISNTKDLSLTSANGIRCHGGLGCKVKRIFCIRPKHKHSKTNKRYQIRYIKRDGDRNGQKNSTHIP